MSQLRRRRLTRENEESVPMALFLSREQEFERVCAEFRALLRDFILPLVERQVQLQELLSRLKLK